MRQPSHFSDLVVPLLFLAGGFVAAVNASRLRDRHLDLVRKVEAPSMLIRIASSNWYVWAIRIAGVILMFMALGRLLMLLELDVVVGVFVP